MTAIVRQSRVGSQRFVVLDFYRYVAATGVFLFHVKSAHPELPIPAVGSYGLFVDMFFILSGFVLFYTYRDRVQSKRDYHTFIIKRLARVYPLYLVMLLVFVGAQVVAGGFPSAMSMPREFAVNAVLLQAWGVSTDLTFNTPAWSISAEFACYLLFPLIAGALVRLPMMLAFAVAGVCYVIGAHGHLPIWTNEHSQMYGATFDFGLIRALAGFLNGIVLCRLFTSLTPRRGYLWLGIASMVAAIVCMNVFAKPDIVILLMAVATCSTALGEAAFGAKMRLASVLEWFGNTSYSIYLLHSMLIIAVVSPLLSSWSMSEGALCGILLAFIVGLTLISHVVYTIFEAPARRWVTLTFTRPALAPPSAPATVEAWQPRVQD